MRLELPAQNIILLVRWLAVGLACVDLSLVAFILYRRASRNRFYAEKDAAQAKFALTVTDYLGGHLELEAAIAALQARRGAEREAIKALLLNGIDNGSSMGASQLLFALGYVHAWAEQAFGKQRSRQLLDPGGGQATALPSRPTGRLSKRIRRMRLFSVPRAVAVGNLGRLSEHFIGACLSEALRDPSPYVARLAVAALGRNPRTKGAPLLLEELRRAAEGTSEVPIRSIKTALVRYGILDVKDFRPFLNESSPRFRFLAVDTIREICRREKPGLVRKYFPAELRRWFLERAARDDSPDVRARSAAVLCTFHDDDATAALRRLLQDENEFVRMHAVRASADPYYSELVEDVLRRITDSHWRVREGAVLALASLGPIGRRKIEKFFLETTDRYASEQIVEELQRSGVIMEILAALALPSGEHRQATAVCSKMVRLGMDSLLTDFLAGHPSHNVRAQLLQLLSGVAKPRVMAVLRKIAANENDPLKTKAEILLTERAARAAAAAQEQN